jgi:uncharacterized protein YbjQ (UPF0145 family)
MGKKNEMKVNLHEIPILTTMEAPPGYRVERVIGPCWGITVRSRSVFGQICAACQTLFGGEITALTELANDSRNEAMSRLETHCRRMGGNAVLMFRFDSGDLMQNTNEIVAYGTAVVIAPAQAAPQSYAPQAYPYPPASAPK